MDRVRAGPFRSDRDRARLKREYGVVIPDELIIEMRTPRQLLNMVNRQIAA